MPLSGTILSVGNWTACVTPYHVPVFRCCTLNPTLKKLVYYSKMHVAIFRILHGTTSPTGYSHCSLLWYGQVKIYLFLMKPHVNEDVWRTWAEVTRVCNFGSRWSWGVNLKPWQLYPFDEKDRRLDGHQEPVWMQRQISYHCLTYLLTPWSRVLLEKITSKLWR